MEMNFLMIVKLFISQRKPSHDIFCGFVFPLAISESDLSDLLMIFTNCDEIENIKDFNILSWIVGKRSKTHENQ